MELQFQPTRMPRTRDIIALQPISFRPRDKWLSEADTPSAKARWYLRQLAVLLG
jgi:hypothetical protein